MAENEQWKDIKGYEGLYQISNTGKVKSLPRISWNGHGYFMKKEQIMSVHDNTHGYFALNLFKDNKKKIFKIHRLVAENFIPNPYKFECVNHKDGNKKNNSIENLEWVTKQENCQHAYNTGLHIPSYKNKYALRTHKIEEVKKIKKIRRENNWGADKISKILNLPRGFVNKVIYGKIYKEVA